MTTLDPAPVPAADQQTCLGTLAAWAAGLRRPDVPDRVAALAGSQVLSQLAAIRAGRAHPLGAAVVRGFGPPFQPDVKQSAYVLAALGAWLHYDDTAYAGHLGNSTVTVPTDDRLARLFASRSPRFIVAPLSRGGGTYQRYAAALTDNIPRVWNSADAVPLRW